MTNRQLIGLAAVLFSAVSVLTSGGAALGQVTMQFPANKDVGISGYNDVLDGSPYSNQLNSSGGSSGTIRGLKTTQNVAIMDFDTAAMAQFLVDNPGTATWTFNVQVATGIGGVSGPDFTEDVQVLTIESTNDWAESDGSADDVNLNWNQAEAAATYFYAQTLYTGDPGNVSGGVGPNTFLDTANSLEWIDPDSGPYVMIPSAPAFDLLGVPYTVGGKNDGTTANLPTPEFTNSMAFTAQQLWESWGYGGFASLPLDNVIANAMMNDVNNRGLRFGPLVNSINSNWKIQNKEQAGGVYAPYLEVTVTPSVGTPGDFDGDGDVDGNDFLEWQRGNSSPGGALSASDLQDWQNGYAPLVANVGNVPEPNSLLLISLGSLLALGRRRSRS